MIHEEKMEEIIVEDSMMSDVTSIKELANYVMNSINRSIKPKRRVFLDTEPLQSQTDDLFPIYSLSPVTPTLPSNKGTVDIPNPPVVVK